jgi:hypothetical protein
MYCQESVDQKLVHRETGAWDGQDGSQLFDVIPNRNRQEFHAEQILTEYTGRNVSFVDDTLNACLGIFKAARITHHQGIPIEQDPKSKKYFLNLHWANREPDAQQLGFPTWSWTSTGGQKIFPKGRRPDRKYLRMHVPDAAGRWRSVGKWIASSDYKGTGITQLSQCLRITARIGTPIFVDTSWLDKNLEDKCIRPSGQGPFMFIEHSSKIRTLFRVHLDRKTDSIHSLSDAIILLLQRGGGWHGPEAYPVMLILVRASNEERYQRVGITDWDDKWEYVKRDPKPGEIGVEGMWRVHQHWIVTERPGLTKNFEKKTLYLE